MERWGRERCSARAALLRWRWWWRVVVVVVRGMGWDGRGSEEICASRLVNHAHVVGAAVNTAVYPEHTHTHTHSLKNTYIINKQEEKHTPTRLTQGAPTVTDLLCALHRLWGEYGIKKKKEEIP